MSTILLTILATSLALNCALILLILTKHKPKISDNVDKYLLLLNLIEQRIPEYRELYTTYDEQLKKRYQIENPRVVHDRKSYANELRRYLNTLIKDLLSEFSKSSRRTLLDLFTEEGLAKYLLYKIIRS